MRHATKRQSGGLLVELMVALVVITVGIMGYMGTMTQSASASTVVEESDAARAALENVVEALRNADFDQLYTNYASASLEVPELLAPYGGTTAAVGVTCFVNEQALPSQFGPVLDLDGTGGLDTTDVSASYQLMPIRLALTYQSKNGTVTQELYLVLGER